VPKVPEMHVVLTTYLAKVPKMPEMPKVHVFLTVYLAKVPKVPEMHVFCILHAFWQFAIKSCKLQTF
jgi:hypothetical protein